MYYLPSISNAIGFGTSDALGQTGIVGIVNFLSTFLAFSFMDKFGRRSLLMSGALLMGLSMALLGFLGLWYLPLDVLGRPVVENTFAAYACVACVMIFMFAFAWSAGPVIWCYPVGM